METPDFEKDEYRKFYSRLEQLATEGFAVGRFGDFKDISAREICDDILDWQKNRDAYGSPYAKINFGKTTLDGLPDFCAEALRKIESESGVEKRKRDFFFESMRDFFIYRTSSIGTKQDAAFITKMTNTACRRTRTRI
ncbi:MAG: hypothetical protein LBL66_02180 [Clostridiales bacterium]|jgi:hypothetical protein|nr:hypothetical protein [Clostridiales bacterium]